MFVGKFAPCCLYVCFLIATTLRGAIASIYTVEAQKDLILNLPGAQIFDIKSRQFSGFLNISSTKFIHYYFIESENDAIKDPIIFWTNGGPGCSGLLGLFTGKKIFYSFLLNITL